VVGSRHIPAFRAMGVVAALLRNPVHQHRLQVALRARHAIELCTDWGDLALACDRHPVHLAVIDLFAFGPMSLEPLRQLKRRLPRLGTVAYVTTATDRSHDLFDAGRAGIDALVVADVDDDPLAFADILERAEARSVTDLLRDHVAHLRPAVLDAVLVSVTRAHEHLTADALARTVSVSRRMLAKQLERVQLPSPQRLLTWGRLIVAAHLLEDHLRSADSVANALHFPSGSAFRNTCQRYLQATPSQIRAHGGALFVIGRMLAEGAAADSSAA
jgi:AraC-like DNA-binding protein